MPITYIGMNDRWIKGLTAAVLILVLIVVIWGVGIFLGGASEPAVIEPPMRQLPKLRVGGHY
jgi:hypothetical protein